VAEGFREAYMAEFRPSGVDAPLRRGLASMAEAWETDEFVLEPSRISLYIGPTGSTARRSSTSS